MAFSLLFENVFPLYGIILIGFLIGRFAKLEVEPVATLMIYGLIPVVMFGATATMQLSSKYLMPPLIIGALSVIASTTGYQIARRVWPRDSRANLLGMIGVGSNAAYFGIPVALALVGKEWLGVYMMMLLPLFILDATLAFYFAARGQFHAKESLRRVARLPIVYGACAGLITSLSGFSLSPILVSYWERFTGAVITVGMMMIGASLARMERTRFDPSFFVAAAILRYILWPALGMSVIALDLFWLQIFPAPIHTMIFLICICPIAANNVAFAAKLNLHPVLTATTVLASSLLALVFMPFAFWIKSLLHL